MTWTVTPEVQAIRRLVASGVPQQVVASLFLVSKTLVCNIIKRRLWAHV